MDTEHQVKFSGSAEIPFPLDRDKNYVLAGEWEEVSRTETDLKNGSVMITFKVKPVRIATVDEAGKKIRLKTKNANSVRIRGAVFREQEKRQSDVDRDLYYDMFTDRLIENLPAVLSSLEL